MPNTTVNLPTKGLMSRLASCRVVLWALGTHGPRMVEILGGPATVPTPEVEGEAPYEPLLETLVQRLAEARDLLIATDRGHRDQKAKTSEYRRMRDGVFSSLNKKVVGLRDTIKGAYSLEIVEQVGFALRTPDQPGPLAEQVTHLVARLSDPELKLTSPKFENISVDVVGLAGELAPLSKRLAQRMEDVSREERGTEATKFARDKALKGYDREFVWCARTAESLFQLANLPELADRVRPSTRRPGVTVEVENQGSETDSGDSDTDTVDDAPPASDETPSDDPPIAG